MIENRKKELRSFGLVVGAVFAGLAMYPAAKGRMVILPVLLLALALMLTGIVRPLLLAPVHAAWMRLGHVLGRVNSFLLLGTVFYLIVTPIGFFRRMFEKDKRFDFRRQTDSSWVRRADDRSPESLKRQF